jgi:hypothetical protein
LMPKGENVLFACVSIWIWFSIWIWLGHKLLYRVLARLCPMVELIIYYYVLNYAYIV